MDVFDEPPDFVASGSNVKIPITNIWLLMFYASRLRQADLVDSIDVEDRLDDLPELAASLLAKEVRRRLRIAPSRGYRPRSDVLHRVRGRINLLETESKQLLRQGLVSCTFDELSMDIYTNQYALYALDSCARQRDVTPGTRRDCRVLAARLRDLGVKARLPTRSELASESRSRGRAADDRMLAAARLVLDLAIPRDTKGAERILRPTRDIVWLRQLYEAAVRGFYTKVLGDDWNVRGSEQIQWSAHTKSGGIGNLLPIMKTDTNIEHGPTGSRIIIETKFTDPLVHGQFGTSSSKKFKTGHLYQIFAYLKNQEEKDALGPAATGVLLYPAVLMDIDEEFTVQGHRIRIVTIDLAAPAADIRSGLIDLAHTSIPTQGGDPVVAYG